MEQKLENAIESEKGLLLLVEDFDSLWADSLKNGLVQLVKVLVDFFGDNEWTDILVLCEEYDDFIA